MRRVAIVTGGARGIGRGIALRLAADGHDVAVCDLRGSAIPSVAQEIQSLGQRSHTIFADVSKEDEVKDMVDSVVNTLGSVDIMVANAGIGPLGTILNTTLEDFEKVQSVNTRGVFLCYKYAALRMVAQGRGGRIIGASSVAGKQAYEGMFAYCASKFAVRGMTQAAAAELAKHKITVNAYAPGLIDTPLLRGVAGHPSNPVKSDISHFWDNIPVGRPGIPEDIAGLVSYLASEESSFITGQSISINGGRFFD